MTDDHANDDQETSAEQAADMDGVLAELAAEEERLRQEHPAAEIEAERQYELARGWVVRALKEHMPEAFELVGVEAEELRSIPARDAKDALAWAKGVVNEDLPALLVTAGLSEAAEVLRDAELADEGALQLAGERVLDVGEVIRHIVQEQGFGVTGLIVGGVYSTVVSAGAALVGDGVGAGLGVIDVARTTPSIHYLLQVAAQAEQPERLDATEVMTACAAAGTNGADAEAKQQAEDVAA
jgi:hypothetical protein